MQSQPATCSDPYKLPFHIFFGNFSIRARKVVFGPCSVFDEDIFDLPTSLSRSPAGSPRHLSQTGGISPSADGGDDSRG